MRLIVSRAARADLKSIAQYTDEHWGHVQTGTYIRSIRERIAAVAARPYLGRPREELGSGYRSTLCGSHIVFYQVTERTVVVLHVLHQQMDAALHL
jgi:toxin ParE1/3/4